MFRPAFGVAARTLLRRFCGQATAAGSLSRPAGASMLRHLHANAAVATAGHRYGLFRRYLKPHAMAMAGLSTAGVGLWYTNKRLPRLDIGLWYDKIMNRSLILSEIGLWYDKIMKRDLPPSEIDWDVPSGAGVSEADWVKTCVVSSADWVAEVDWVEAGAVSPVVRNQRHCGCCWAMAAAASVEAMHYLKTSKSISLSVQELIDCDTKSKGCDGGLIQNALRYVQENGLSSEPHYPYKGERSISGCKQNKIAATSRISGFQFVDPTEDALEKAVARQPVVVSLHCSDGLMRYYKGGIVDYEPVSGMTNEEHYVLIVGYGTDSNGVKYWRFKNSWGPIWGEGGFGRIRRHVKDERGALGIFLKQGVYPVLKD
ncbi:ervatamin-B isoform X2 [Triticum aestivum]|uniref:ervatamin-B isoform X2 n=1 Tax=Triticum aestivum TaxID=4565 RepID=UPI001D022E63|nr:ervatamin-B-like isoform X2 [Triticum aestivum]